MRGVYRRYGAARGGLSRCGGSAGTSFSLDHVRTLSRFAKRIICMFDGDAAGQRAAERAIQFIDKSEADLRCVVLPNGQDPAEFLDTHNPSDLEKILGKAEPLMDFVLRKRLENVSPTAPGGVRMGVLDDLAGVLAPLKNSVLLDEYALVVGDWLGISPEEVKRAIKAKPVAREREDRYAPASAPAQRGTDFGRVAAPSYQEGGWDDCYVPDDYVPYEAMDAPASQNAPSASVPHNPQTHSNETLPLTSDERLQLRAERELLLLMATYPDAMRAHADRIATFLWADERHETMAWAMLATPDGTPSADVVQAATHMVPDAPRILASGSVASATGLDDEAKISFVLDTVELYSTRRRIAELRAGMRLGNATSQGAFLEATNLQRYANQLANRVSSGFNRQ